MLLDAALLRAWFRIPEGARAVRLKRMLARLRCPYWTDTHGDPITTLAAVEKALGLTDEASAPNLAALEEAPAQGPRQTRRAVLGPSEPLAQAVRKRRDRLGAASSTRSRPRKNAA